MLFWDGRPEIQKGMFIKEINNKNRPKKI